MADRKISELSALTGANSADDDVLVIVDTSADETKKITLGELENALAERDFSLDDDDKLLLGSSNDGELYHNGTNAYFESNTGDLRIIANEADKDVRIYSDNGSGGTTEYFRADGSIGQALLFHYGTKKFNTTSNGIDITQDDDGSSSGPILDLMRESDSPADLDFIGRIDFSGKNDADQNTIYGQIIGQITDATDGTEDGSLRITTKRNGSLRSRVQVNTTNTTFNEDSQDFDFRVETDGQANMLFVDGGNDRIGVKTGSPTYTLDVAGDIALSSTAALVGKSGVGGDTQLLYWQGTTAYYGRNTLGGSVTNHEFRSGGTTRLSVKSSEVVVNDTGGDYDFRVESSDHSYALFMNGANGGVQMGGSNQTTVGTPGEGRLALIRSNGSPQLNMYRNDTSIGAGDILGFVAAHSNDTTSNSIKRLARIDFAADGAFSAGDNPTKIVFYTTEDATEADREIAKFDNRGTFFVNRGAVFNEAGSAATNADFRVESDTNTHALFLDASANHVNIGGSADYGGTFNVITTQTGNALTVNSTSASATHGPNIRIFRDSESPADNDYIGRINFDGKTGDGSSTTYAQILTQIRDVTAGTEDARMKLGGLQGGTFANYFDAQPTETVINEDSLDRDFRVESDGNNNIIFVNAGADRVSIGMSGGSERLNVNGSIQLDHQGSDGFSKIVGPDNRTLKVVLRANDDNDAFLVEDDRSAGSERLTVNAGGEMVVNETSADYDFRVESNNTTHMLFVDAGSDKVGIGTSTPQALLHVNGSGGGTAPNIFLENAGGSEGDITFDSGEILQVGTWNTTSSVFDELMTIHSNGKINFPKSDTVEIGRNDDANTYDSGERGIAVYAGASGDNTILYARNVADGSPAFRCQIDGTTKGEIEANGDFLSATNSYGGTSDQTLKENIVASGSQWDDLKAVQVKKFSYIADDLDTANMIGVIAQDLEASGMSGLVSSMDRGDGTMVKTVKYSILYMKAIKALQEAMERIETLETKVAALESAS